MTTTDELSRAPPLVFSQRLRRVQILVSGVIKGVLLPAVATSQWLKERRSPRIYRYVLDTDMRMYWNAMGLLWKLYSQVSPSDRETPSTIRPTMACCPSYDTWTTIMHVLRVNGA